jgi:adenine deaminase
MIKAQNSGSLNILLVDVFQKLIRPVCLRWQDGVITDIQPNHGELQPGYLMPGFVDAHVHIESSMLPPAEFARIAVRHGTVATVSDPHEIANVLGIDGINYMLQNAATQPMPILFGAPSCVPATPFETAGAELDATVLESLFQEKSVGYLAEMMNYPGVLARDSGVMQKLELARRYQVPVDGHAPGLTGLDAARYAQAGIHTDHECSTLQEAKEKLALGMHILIREGSAARNFAALHPLISEFPERIMFCSDDKHPDDLIRGHINQLAARAIAEGHDVFAVLRCACVNPVLHYGLSVGQLRVGDRMDAIHVSDLTKFDVIKTWLNGELVAEQGRSLHEFVASEPVNHFAAQSVSAEDFQIPCPSSKVRVIGALDGELLTHSRVMTPSVQDGLLASDISRDLLLLTVVNRYRSAPPSVALIQGFGLQRGALASSVSHDSHHIVAVGTSPESLAQAVNRVIQTQGGIAVADETEVFAMPLAIAGLMSKENGDAVALHYAELDSKAKQWGSTLRAPFMTLSFMALLVIPELKLSDQGLFDGVHFQPVDLFVS